MPREYNISWNANQRKALNSAVRRYNTILRNEIKRNPLAARYLPDQVNYQELKSTIKTARALKNTVNRLNRIKRPDALHPYQLEDGSIISTFEKREFSILKGTRERMKAAKAKRLGITQPEGRLGTPLQAQLSPDRRSVRQFTSMGIRRFIKYQTREMHMTVKDRAALYYRNYIKALESVFGGVDEYAKDVASIQITIRDMYRTRADELIELLESDREEFRIGFVYDPIARASKLNRLKEAWYEYAN